MSDVQLVALLDGRLVPPASPLIRVDDAGVVRGDGVFETALVVDGTPRDLDEHLERLAVSAAMIDLELPAAQDWRVGIGSVLAGWTGQGTEAPDQMVLRLTATRGAGDGPTCYVTGGPVNPTILRQRATGVGVLALDRGFAGPEAVKAPWLLAGAKTLSYAINMAAVRYAVAHGADDAIFVGSDGAVLEAPTATVVVARDERTLVTPPTDGILDGITARRLLRAAAAAGWTVLREPLAVEDLRQARGVWLASSVRLLVEVRAIDGVARPESGMTADLAELLQMPAGA